MKLFQNSRYILYAAKIFTAFLILNIFNIIMLCIEVSAVHNGNGWIFFKENALSLFTIYFIDGIKSFIMFGFLSPILLFLFVISYWISSVIINFLFKDKVEI